MKIKDIINLTRPQIRNTKAKDLRTYFKKLKDYVFKEVDKYKAHGLEKEVPKEILNIPKGTLSTEELVNAVNSLSNFAGSSRFKYSDFMEKEREDREQIEEDLDIRFRNYDEYNEYKEFLKDMYSRDKKGWRLSSEQYEEAQELFIQARRLNLKASQFLRNRDYWLEHVQELEEATPIKTDKKLYPSRYIKQLRLPSVKEWEND